jgi:hypothetical protein
LQHVHRTAHAHQDRTDQFPAAHFRRELARDIGRGQIGEYQNVRAALE